MEIKKTKLISVYTDELEDVKTIFVESIKDDWEIVIRHLGRAGEGNGDFSSKGFYDVQRKKVEFQVEQILKNWGDVIIYADIDIQFFAKCADRIALEIAGKDLVFQAEHWPEREVNVGFAVIRCNDKTLKLYQSVLKHDFTKLPIADQTAMNISLNEGIGDVKWDILPNQFWAMSHYAHNSTNPPIDILLHHANCTHPKVINGKKVGSVELKLEQFKTVRNYVSSLKEKLSLYYDPEIDNLADNSDIRQLISELNLEVLGNGNIEEETLITFAFYLHIALIKVSAMLKRDISTAYGLDTTLNTVEIAEMFEENKETLEEIYADIMCADPYQSERIPDWLKKWMILCNEKLIQATRSNAPDNDAYKQKNKQIIYLINKHTGMTESMAQVLNYFIGRITTIRKPTKINEL